MRDPEPDIEDLVADYVVSACLFKAVERDRRYAEHMKLARVWKQWFERVSRAAEREYVRCRRGLREAGCRIVLEELTGDRHLHVMYVYRRYEFHSYFVPFVIKARCEEKLMDLIFGEARNFDPAGEYK